jgi:hypothetical protein
MLKKTICTSLVIITIHCVTACRNSNTVETFTDTSFFEDEYTPLMCSLDTATGRMVLTIKGEIKDTLLTTEELKTIKEYLKQGRIESQYPIVSSQEIEDAIKAVTFSRKVDATFQSIKLVDKNGDTQVIEMMIPK